MTQYIIRRVLLLIPVMLIVGIVAFTLVHLTPGDPASVIAGPDATSEEVERLREGAGSSTIVGRLRDWDPDPEHGDVPDPYFGGDHGFEMVHDIVERACRAMLDDLLNEPA